MNIEEAQIINQKIRVLHVDDEELQLITLKNTLELINKDIIVESERDGSKAIEKIKDNDYDIILLDYFMPVYNGLEIAGRIREISNIPIILYTIQDIKDISEKSFNIGINDYFKKDLENNYVLLEKKIISLVKKNRTEKIFNKILQNVTDSILILNERFKIIFYNEQFINKYKEDDIIGKSIINLIDDLHKESFRKYLLNNDDNFIELVIENSKKIKYSVEIYKSTININDKFTILNIKNVADSIMKSSIDHTSDDRFNAIAEMSPDAIMTINMWGYITYINNAFSKLTGFPENEVVGKHMLRIPTMAGRNLKPYLDLVKSFFSGNFSTRSFEFPYSRKDGSSGIGDAYLNIIQVNGKRELIAILKDITERKKKEEEYQNIFKTSPEGIIHLDLSGKIKDINSSGLQILEINSSKYIGKSIFELDNELEQDINFKQIYDDLINNKYVEPFEIEQKYDKKVKYIEINVGLIKTLDEVLGIQVVLRDITQQKMIEQERIAYTEKLETLVQERTNQIVDNEKMIAVAKVSSMIAHDLKGPLQVIQNTLYLLEHKPENQEMYLTYIRTAVKQANDLIEEMREKGKKTPLSLEYVNLNKLIDESLIQVKVSENVSFETIIRCEKEIRLDKSKFIRVFNNLFKNAIEAMPEGGKITILGEEKDDYISIKIMDTGVGIPQDKLNTLFRPFQSTKAKGMGLGLTFCKNTIEAHGGNISVDSELGKGTTFTITIPMSIEEEINNQYIDVINIKDTLME